MKVSFVYNQSDFDFIYLFFSYNFKMLKFYARFLTDLKKKSKKIKMEEKKPNLKKKKKEK